MGLNPGPQDSGTSYFTFSCLPHWANLASVNWGIFNFTFVWSPINFASVNWLHFCLCTNWFYNLDNLSEIKRYHSPRVLVSILTGGNFLLNLSCSYLHKHLANVILLSTRMLFSQKCTIHLTQRSQKAFEKLEFFCHLTLMWPSY